VKSYLTRRLRDYFNEWKQRAETVTVTEFMEEEGPVRMEIRKANQEIENITSMLKEEGYSPDEIAKVVRNGNEQKLALLNKAVARMKHYNEDQYVKPLAL
jgi:hypothetical protein